MEIRTKIPISRAALLLQPPPCPHLRPLWLAENGDTFLLLVGEAKDGWYQIQYEGKTAYVSEDYVTVKEVSVEEAAKLRGEGGSSESSSEGSSSEESSDAPDSKAPESSATTAPGVSRDSEDGEA